METLPEEKRSLATQAPMGTLPDTDVIREAERILHFSSEQRLTLRLLGGLGVWFSAPSAVKPEYARNYHDLDFIGHRKQATKVGQFFVEMGYAPRELFNKLQAGTRLMFNDMKNGRRVDIFLDEFAMCHKFDFKDRLELCEKTLPPCDLLITKLQIFEINKKDVMDIVTLVLDTPVTAPYKTQRHLDVQRIVEVCSEDWGIYKTITMNVERTVQMLPELGVPSADVSAVRDKLSIIRNEVEAAPKSFRWKLRAKMGEKVKWYELPESGS